jgi:ATP-dependent Clp protease ATP-binding subunit ClpC
MSEFMEKISISRITGSAPGYVGYDDSNFLDKVRRKPYSVVLFDEIEKAHSEIFNLFLQVLDDGYMTDSHGRKVSFKNTIILMSSNIGTKVVKDFGGGVGFNTSAKLQSKDSNIKSTLEKELKKKFAPEFINRLDEIIYFNDLSKEDILKIVDLELNKTLNRSIEIGYELTITEALKSHITEVGYSKEYGARPLKRTLQRLIDDEVTEFIINNPKKNNDIVKLQVDFNQEDESVIVKKMRRTKKDE